MKLEINLWDINQENVHVKIKEHTISHFFDYAVDFAGTQDKLARLLGKKRLSHIKEFKTGKSSVQLKLIENILSLFPEGVKKKFMRHLEKNVEEIKCYASASKSIKNPKFPIRFSTSLAKILGHLMGDGYIEMRGSTPSIGYTNKNRVLIENFKKDVERVFGEINTNDRINVNDVFDVRYPSIIGILLSNLLGHLPKSLDQVPSLIVKLDKESKSLFLRALYDDEGYVSVSKYQIGIEMSNKNVIKMMKMLLLEFGIESGKLTKIIDKRGFKPRHGFRISNKKNLQLFLNKIGFDHPLKKERLITLLQKYKYK